MQHRRRRRGAARCERAPLASSAAACWRGQPLRAVNPAVLASVRSLRSLRLLRSLRSLRLLRSLRSLRLLLPLAPQYYRLLTVSSHYNTQLGVLSALQHGAAQQGLPESDYPWRRRIPSTAAVLAFELHASAAGAGDEAGHWAVRAVAQDGPASRYAVLPLPCADAAGEALAGPGACSLGAFRALAAPQAISSAAEWCAACGNEKVMACVVQRMQRQLAQQEEGSAAMRDDSSGGGGSVPAGMVALYCVVSVAAAAVLAVAGLLGARALRRRRGGRQSQHDQVPAGLSDVI